MPKSGALKFNDLPAKEREKLRFHGDFQPPTVAGSAAWSTCATAKRRSRALLRMMGLHLVQDVIEEADSVDDVLALVQHHALGPHSHGGIGNLGARRNAGLGKRLEYLRGPDHRHVRSFAEPQNLFLNLSQTLEANLDRKIAARHHDSNGMMAQRRDHDERELIESRPAFDLEDDSQPPLAARGQFLMQFEHVFGPPDEGQANDICVFSDKVEVAPVFLRYRADTEIGVGKIDALPEPSFASCAPVCRISTSMCSGCTSQMRPSILPSSKKMG